jgi:isochorismate synthase EntC
VQEKENMTSTDSSKTSDADLVKGRDQATAEIHIPAPNKVVSPRPHTISSGRRLDVDAVLERSVRKVGTE